MDSWRAELKSRVEQYSSRRKRESHSIRVMENKSTTAVKSQKIHVREMLGKSRIAVFFQWFVRSGVCKVGSLKRRVRRELLRRDRKNCTPLWREAHFYVKMYKTPQCRSHFASLDLEKLHAAVARSTFLRQNVQNTSVSEPFCKSRSGKKARRCGAKHICKSKCTKHLSSGAILQVTIRKNGTPLWREAHL